MAVKYGRILVICIFAVCVQLLVVDLLAFKGNGYWGSNEFRSTVVTIQTGVKTPEVNSTPAVQYSSREFNYIDELWECVKGAGLSSIPYFIYWYYYWYL